MKLSALGAALLAACATAACTTAATPVKRIGLCGTLPPVRVIARSAFYWDVDFRDARETKLFTVEGLKTNQRRTFCAYPGMGESYILDPVVGGYGSVVQTNQEPQPGGTLLLSIGSQLQISFADVLGPDPE